MKSFCIILITLQLLSSLLSAQENQADFNKLTTKLNNAEEYDERVGIYKKIIENKDSLDPEKIFPLAKNLLMEAEDDNDKKSIGLANFYLGKYYYNNDNFSIALKHFSEALKVYQKQNDSE